MILRNSGICPKCKEEIVSRFRHDYVECSCGHSFVDGGLYYERRSVDLDSTSIYSEDPFDVLRSGFEWGTYGINGDESLEYKRLKDLTSSHITAIIEGGYCSPGLKDIFIKELKFRDDYISSS